MATNVHNEGFYVDKAGYDAVDKDPSDVIDYGLDYANWLETGEEITGTPTWTVPTGITKSAQANTTTTATAMLSGGTAGKIYIVSCTVNTTAGRTLQRSFRVHVKQK